jgi:hypothetical protein
LLRKFEIAHEWQKQPALVELLQIATLRQLPQQVLGLFERVEHRVEHELLQGLLPRQLFQAAFTVEQIDT